MSITRYVSQTNKEKRSCLVVGGEGRDSLFLALKPGRDSSKDQYREDLAKSQLSTTPLIANSDACCLSIDRWKGSGESELCGERNQVSL